MAKEWINWDLNLNLTTENMDQRGQLFERILDVPNSAWGNVCWYMHYKIYSHLHRRDSKSSVYCNLLACTPNLSSHKVQCKATGC